MSGRAPGVARPIVLATGIARFDILVQGLRHLLSFLEPVTWSSRILVDALGYFRYIGRTLQERGFEVHETSVSFAGSLDKRGADLRRAVEQILAGRGPQARVNIIAHSMGGLDARYMVARLGMADRVASLVTIGTPHLGSSLADWRYEDRKAPRWIIHRLKSMGVDFSGAFDLTTRRCRAFGAEVEAAEAANGITYITYAAAQRDRSRVFWPLRRSWDVVREREGTNDGLVSFASQLWQAELRGPNGGKRVERREFPLPADHLNEIGWWHPWAGPIRERQEFERRIRNVYVQIAEDLRARGLYG